MNIGWMGIKDRSMAFALQGEVKAHKASLASPLFMKRLCQARKVHCFDLCVRSK